MSNNLSKRTTLRLLRLVFSIGFLCLLSAPVDAQTQPQVDLRGMNILIVHSLEGSAPVFVETDKGLITKLESGGIPRVNQFIETLDLRRNPGREHRRLLVEQMRVRYGHRKLDMIITMYPEAVEFVLRDCRDTFAGVPLLALYLPQSFELPERDRLIIGHSATRDIIGTLEIALKLVPGVKRVYVVSGSHPNDRAVEDQAHRDLKKWETRLEFLYLNHMSFKDILTTLSRAPRDSVLLLLIFSQDIAGIGYTAPDVTRQLNQVSTVPIFGLLDAGLGFGITGGSLINFERIGNKAGEMVLDLLKQVPPPVNVAGALNVPPLPMFDWRQLRRWNLSEAALPKGSVVINREVTIWDFRYYIFGGFVIILAQTLLVIGLLVQRGRKRMAEKSLWQKTQELDEFFNVSLDILSIANTDGFFLRLNPAVERVLGYTREELTAQPLFEFIHPDDVEKTREAISALRSQEKLFSFHNRYRCKDGSYRWLEWSANAVGDRIYAAARDLTERNRAELEALEARRELTRMDRLSRMGELTASIAHELNQPLTSILSNAGAALRFIKSGSLDMNELTEILEDIARDDKRAANIIRSLRSLVGPKDEEREVINMNDLLAETIALFNSEAIIHKIRLEGQFEDSLPSVTANRVQLQQVVINLLMNAAESMKEHEHKRITVATRTVDGNKIQVAVRDSGTGISEQELGRIFEPFFTTKRSGLGMGLSLARSIIEAHAGHIWAENNPDGGTTFYFDLPGMPHFSQ